MIDNIHYFKFDYGQTAQVVESAPENVRPGTIVSVVGMTWDKEGGDSPWGFFPAGTDFYLIEYEDGSSIEVPEEYIKAVEGEQRFDLMRVHFDWQYVWLTKDGIEQWRLPWKNVSRMGYAITSLMLTADDCSFVLRDNSEPSKFYQLYMAWDGVRELWEFVDKTKDVKYPTDKHLANCIVPKTTTIWPPSESGKSLGLWESVKVCPVP